MVIESSVPRREQQPRQQRAADERDDEAEDATRCTLSAPPLSRGSANAPPAAAWVTMCTSMSPDSRITVAPMPGSGQRRREAAAAAHADDELRRVDRAREVDERARDVVADDLVVGAAERLDERALRRERARRRRAQAVLARHVHREQLAAGRAGGDAGAAAQQGLALRAAGQRDDDALARLPRAVDAVLGAVRLQRAVDLVGEPEQGELAQRGEVAEAEVVRQGRVDPLGRVDRAGREPVAQRLRREVDDLDLVGAAHDGVRHRLALGDAGDLLDDVVRATRCAGR